MPISKHCTVVIFTTVIFNSILLLSVTAEGQSIHAIAKERQERNSVRIDELNQKAKEILSEREQIVLPSSDLGKQQVESMGSILEQFVLTTILGVVFLMFAVVMLIFFLGRKKREEDRKAYTEILGVADVKTIDSISGVKRKLKSHRKRA